MVAVDDDLWFTSYTNNGADSRVSRIDTATNRIVTTASVRHIALGLAYDGTDLWVSNFDSPGHGRRVEPC